MQPISLAAAGMYSVPARAQAPHSAQGAFAGVADVEEERRWSMGSVSDGLLDVCGDVDLLVVGLHHRSPFGRLIYGSTAEAVLRRLPCALLAVPDAAQPQRSKDT
jgi:nucleotide-binding universal stress UspA family protein